MPGPLSNSSNYDVAILDLGLPDGDGLAVLDSARRVGKTLPILILTARDAVDDRVAGLDAGADDYLTKPFAITELVARIKALLRRPGGVLGITLEACNLSLDTIGRDFTVDGNPVRLSRQELAILEQMMRRFGRIVPKAVLEEKLYGIGDEPDSNPGACSLLAATAAGRRRQPVHSHRSGRRLHSRRRTGMTPRLKSLQLRLTVELGALFLAASCLAMAGLIYSAFLTAGSVADRELDLRAEDLAHYILLDATGHPRLELPPALRQAYYAAAQQSVFAIRDKDGRLVATSRPSSTRSSPHGGRRTRNRAIFS